MNYLKSQGIQVPKQIGVMGFSNWKIAEVMSPGLSTVEQHGHQMGMKAVNLLVQLLKDQSLGSNETYKIDSDLIIRESTLN